MGVINLSTQTGRDVVYIGRPSKWGNPFKVGVDGTRGEVIEKYRDHVLSTPELMGSLYELEGKDLGCWCKPNPCHGDVLEELLQRQTLDNLFK